MLKEIVKLFIKERLVEPEFFAPTDSGKKTIKKENVNNVQISPEEVKKMDK